MMSGNPYDLTICSTCNTEMTGECPLCEGLYCVDCEGVCICSTPTTSLIILLAGPRLVALLLLLGCLLLSACTDGSDQSITGQPSISAAFIDQVLSAHGSPAAGMGEAFYTLGQQYNIDPAFALAIFHFESDYGTKGVAVSSLSIGNIRCIPDYSCINGFAYFPTWADGIRAWYVLVSGPLYVGDGLTTPSQIIQRYAPGSDESAYVQSITSDVQSWRLGQIS